MLGAKRYSSTTNNLTFDDFDKSSKTLSFGQYNSCIFNGCDFNFMKFYSLNFTLCTFRNCKFVGTKIEESVFMDCDFILCDFDSANIERGGNFFSRKTSFVDCKNLLKFQQIKELIINTKVA